MARLSPGALPDRAPGHLARLEGCASALCKRAASLILAWNTFNMSLDKPDQEGYGSAVPLLAKSVANEFLELAKRDKKPLTNMQIQKLVYIAHGFNLAFYDAPLIEEQVKAWTWGPVIPPLYNKLKKYGNGSVTDLISDTPKVPDEGTDLALINEVWKGYGRYTGAELSAITHQAGSPWDVTWRTDNFGVIDDALTTEYYKSLLAS